MPLLHLASMRVLLAVIASSCLFVGCVTLDDIAAAKSRDEQAVIGTQVQLLMVEYGKPTSTTDLGNGEVLYEWLWAGGSLMYRHDGANNYWDRVTALCDAEGTVKAFSSTKRGPLENELANKRNIIHVWSGIVSVITLMIWGLSLP